MSINAVTIKSGATLSVTGGTDLAFVATQNTGSAAVLAVSADTDLRIRRKVTLKTTPAKPQGGTPSGYTQQRSEIAYHEPRLLATGVVATDTIRMSPAFDVATSDADKAEMIKRFGQFLLNADMIALMKLGIMA